MVSNRAVNFAKGAARPNSFSHHVRSRRTSSSETEKPRIVVTMLRRLSPAGPTSLLRTPCSMDWLISCNSTCAPDPKATMEIGHVDFAHAAANGGTLRLVGLFGTSGRIISLTSFTSASAPQLSGGRYLTWEISLL
jgi:hypothetical protein